MMFCPFCDDANRKAGYISHGHCYVSKDYPVFYCQRCSTGGSILKLLLFTDFNDEETINLLKQYINTNVVKDFYNFKKNKSKKDLDFRSCQEFIKKSYYEFENKYKDHYNYYKWYLNNRLGLIDYYYFLMYPNFIDINKTYFLSIGFFNRDGEVSTNRILTDNNKINRYKSNRYYYFQEKKFNNKYTNIVLTEGVFDCIKIALYNIDFNLNDTFYYSINGKNYLNILEELILEYLLLGDYCINLIFDNDVKNIERYIFKCQKLVELYNNNIIINGWKPISSFEDAGEFPVLIKV